MKDQAMIRYCVFGNFIIVLSILFAYSYSMADAPNVSWQNNLTSGLSVKGSQATDAPIATVARRFSFQARITQAELPIFEGYIPELTVYYSNGTFSCIEIFNNVRVLDSIINLELGEFARCSFNTLLEQSSLNIKLCLSSQSCFDVDRYQMGSVPSAVKVNQAHQAEIAYLVNRSFLSDYVYPGVKSLNNPDTSFIWSSSLNYISSPWEPQSDALEPSVARQQLNIMRGKGFITWNPPVNTTSAVLTIETASGVALSEFVSVTHTHDWNGNLTVQNTLDVIGNMHVEQGYVRTEQNMAIQANGLKVNQASMKVVGNTKIVGTLEVSTGLSNELTSYSYVESRNLDSFTTDVLDIEGPTEIDGQFINSQVNQQSEYQVKLNSNSSNASSVRGSSIISITPNSEQQYVDIKQELTLQNGWVINNQSSIHMQHDPLLKVSHNSHIFGNLQVSHELQLDGSLHMINNTQSPSIIKRLGNALQVNSDEGFNEVHIKGGHLHFEGPVEFSQPPNAQSFGSDCSITPLIKEGKRIDDVFLIDCAGDQLEAPVTVSALLRSQCGDGVVEFEEQCDNSLSNNDSSLAVYCQDGTNTCIEDCTNDDAGALEDCTRERQNDRLCRTSCVYAGCGDGIRDLKERCDDGNQIDNDSCSQSCRLVTHCKLGVKQQVLNASALVVVDTESLRSTRREIEEDSQLDDNVSWEFTGEQDGINLTCNSFVEANNTQVPNQGAIEIMLDESQKVMVEVVKTDSTDGTGFDTVLYLKEDNCSNVNNIECNDEGGTGNFAMIGDFDPQGRPIGKRLNAGRYYAIVGGYQDNDEGQAYVAVRMLCEDPNRHIETIYADSTTPNRLISFNTQVADKGSSGYVHTSCVEELPIGFVQPTSENFDANLNNLNSGYGRNQAVIEVILKEDTRMIIKAFSESVDPLIYVQNSCDSNQLFRALDDQSDSLNCDDNNGSLRDDPIMNPYAGSAYLAQNYPRGVYYIVVDSQSILGGAINVQLEFEE
jgi:cysteine-rich repeat protein